MRKERKGPLGAVTGLAEDLVATMRRRQHDREPRVVVYDVAGHARVIPDGDERDGLLDLAEDMVALTGGERE
jgi:hypothetical protein